MKKLLLFLCIVSAGFAAAAQEPAPNQNPNYKASLERYKAAIPAVSAGTSFMNTTVQDTYKAYDWRTSKNESKIYRRCLRTEQNRLFNNYRYQYYDPYGYNRGNYYRPCRYNNYRGWRW